MGFLDRPPGHRDELALKSAFQRAKDTAKENETPVVRARIAASIFNPVQSTYTGWPDFSGTVPLETLTEARRFRSVMALLFELLKAYGVEGLYRKLEAIRDEPPTYQPEA